LLHAAQAQSEHKVHLYQSSLSYPSSPYKKQVSLYKIPGSVSSHAPLQQLWQPMTGIIAHPHAENQGTKGSNVFLIDMSHLKLMLYVHYI
jgi:hypothetical protein